MIWTCPNCSTLLTPSHAHWSCPNGHHFDQARQGYVNLLLASAKKSKMPGDSKAMVLARRRFLAAGFYEPLVSGLIDFALTETTAGFAGSWLDVGCGEGYYTTQIQQALLQSSRLVTRWWCLDISKEAIKMAAQLHGASCAVASSFAIPAMSGSCDGVLQIFAPASSSEIFRVLKPNGHLLRVSPGAAHLKELRQAIYPTAKAHTPPHSNTEGEWVAERSIAYTIRLKHSQQIEDLIAMTPYQWKGDRFEKQKLIEHGSLNVSVDFLVQLFRKPTVQG